MNHCGNTTKEVSAILILKNLWSLLVEKVGKGTYVTVLCENRICI